MEYQLRMNRVTHMNKIIFYFFYFIFFFYLLTFKFVLLVSSNSELNSLKKLTFVTTAVVSNDSIWCLEILASLYHSDNSFALKVCFCIKLSASSQIYVMSKFILSRLGFSTNILSCHCCVLFIFATLAKSFGASHNLATA